MQPIQNIVDELRSIAGALVPPYPDPFRRPPRRVYQLPLRVADIGISIDGAEYADWIDPEIWEPTGRAVRGDANPLTPFAHVGTDALAWYVSFHQSGGNWGIFVPVSSLAYLECRILSELPLKREEKWKLALKLLVAHERMHFAVDYGCAQWELLVQAPCWAALKERMRTQQISYLPAEEQLANAYMLQRSVSFCGAPAKNSIEAFVASQPHGYRDGLAINERNAFLRTFTEVIKSYVGLHCLERGLHIAADSYEHFRSFPRAAELETSACPIYVFDDDRLGIPLSAIRFITCIATISETDTFSRRFQKLESSIQSRWLKVKRQLADGIPRSAGFEKLKGEEGNIFSVRLNDSFRVHLRQRDGVNWEAFAVGSHKEMGHG